MSEKIAGITLKETDLSQPVGVRPEGIPAGVIGTAKKGPAFVPVLFANTSDFVKEFGDSSGGDLFGPIAVAEWMKNSKAGLYLRTLGVGNGLKKAAGTGVTANAGFEVGINMRDKDRTSGSGYAALETDNEGDGPRKNPYAGAQVPAVITSVKSHAPYIAPDNEEITLVLNQTPGWADNNALDGKYFIINVPSSDNSSTLLKTLMFFSAQTTSEAGTPGTQPRTIAGLTVVDGSFVTDLSSTGVDQIKFIDLTDKTGSNSGAVANQADLQDAIVYWTGNAVAGSKVSAVESGNDVLLTATHVGAVSVQPTSTLPAGILTSIAGTGGVTEQAHINYDNVLTFEEEILISAGSTLEISDGEGATVTLTFTTAAKKGSPVGAAPEFDLDSLTTPEALLNAVFNYLTGTTGTDLQDGGSAEVAQQVDGAVMAGQKLQVSATPIDSGTSGNQLTLKIEQHSGATNTATPVVTVTEQNPNAPKGRVHFLGVEMFSSGLNASTSVHGQDYLNGAIADGSKVEVLRGVLMFPSGVIPGLAHGSSATVADTDVPSVAFGEYGTGNLAAQIAAGKDIGQQAGYIHEGQFQMILNGYTGTSSKVLKCSFDPKSSIYFPKVMNTDPLAIQTKGHYLYTHYDVPAGLATVTTTSADTCYLVPGAHDHNDGAFSSSGYQPTYENFREKFTHSHSPWIYSQDLGTGPKKLFKIHALDAGKIAFEDQYKIEISNVHQPSKGEYAVFNLKLRKLNDSDGTPIEIPGENYAGLTLDPSSENYIARKIGDMNTFFDFEKATAEKQKIVTEGLYPNKSKHIRVEMNSQVQNGQMDISAMPIGFAGKNHLAIGKGSLDQTYNGSHHTDLNLVEPPLPFRQRVAKSFGNNVVADTNLCWGLETMYVTSIVANREYNASAEKNAGLIYNLTKHFGSTGTSEAWIGDNRGAEDVNTDQIMDADRYNNNFFSLEKLWVAARASGATRQQSDLVNPVDSTWWHEAVYIRNGNTDGNTNQGSGYYYKEQVDTAIEKRASKGYRYLNPALDMVNPSNANLRWFKFVVPMQGGFDGLDIFDADKKAMNDISALREMSDVPNLGGTAGSTVAAFRKGLDILAEKSDVDIQLLAIPGMKNSAITDHAIDKTEDRFDALYVMDIPAYDQEDKIFKGIPGTNVSVVNTAKQLQDRNLDSSFAAAYFPNVMMADPYTAGISVEAPPSCAVLGAMSFNDSVAHPWYAPAGFTRGTLQTVTDGTVIFDKDDLETLHVQDINPITSFANSSYDGMVVWGQKTLLQGKSALDRVNVRRLLIDIRRKVRVVANSILFEPNRESTLAAFSARVNPILARIQQQQGLDRFKVVIDASTTTQQDIENNTIRGKIFLQPTKSIEFISLDFVVGNQID